MSLSVYTAEVAAFGIAADIAINSQPSFTKCIIYANSRAAIRGVNSPNKQSGQEILISTIHKIQSLVTTRNMTIKIEWVPGHENIHGNEEADKAAKEAAQSKGDDVNIPRSTYRPLKSARSINIKREIADDWDQAWQSQAPRDAKQLRRITSEPYTVRGSKLYNAVTLTRHEVAQLARLRTGHCSLNQYLHRFGHSESPRCKCDSGAIESVEHFLLHCSKYDKQRSRLVRKVGVGGMWMEKLLGYQSMIRHTLEYVQETGRLTF